MICSTDPDLAVVTTVASKNRDNIILLMVFEGVNTASAEMTLVESQMLRAQLEVLERDCK